MGCTKLVGGKGTIYDADKTDVEYGHPDGQNGKPGYFYEAPSYVYYVQIFFRYATNGKIMYGKHGKYFSTSVN